MTTEPSIQSRVLSPRMQIREKDKLLPQQGRKKILSPQLSNREFVDRYVATVVTRKSPKHEIKRAELMKKYRNQKSECSYRELGHKRGHSTLGMIEDSKVLDPNQIMAMIKVARSRQNSKDSFNGVSKSRVSFNNTVQMNTKRNEDFRPPSSMYSGSPSPGRNLLSFVSEADFGTHRDINQKTMIKTMKDKLDEEKELTRILKIKLAKQAADHRSQLTIQQQIQNEQWIKIHELQDQNQQMQTEYK